MITAAGASSGIDVEGIISGLMGLEQQPIKKLEQRRANLDVQVSDVGKLKAAVNEIMDSAEALSNPSEFGAWETKSSDEDVLIATNIDGKVAEAHAVEVQALASANRLISGTYDSEAESIDSGTLEITSGDKTVSVVLSEDGNTLRDLQNAINDTVDNDLAFASIINSDTGSRLVLSAKNTGTANAIETSFTSANADPLEEVTNTDLFTELNTASDAQLTINGLNVTSSSNTVEDVIEGVNLNLISVGAANITSEQNSDRIVENLERFTTAYNSTIETLAKLSEGSLRGDNIDQRIESRLRDEIFQGFETSEGSTNSLFDLGFTFDREGKLSIQPEQLHNYLARNSTAFINAFTAKETGFSARIVDAMKQLTNENGFFEGRLATLETRKNSIDRQVLRLENRMVTIETRYRRQFSAMESAIAQLQSSSGYLFQALDTTS